MRHLLLFLSTSLFLQFHAQAELYCYANKTRIQFVQKDSRYLVQILNESSLKNMDPTYLMETMNIPEAEARELASTAKPFEVQVMGFDNCKVMTNCEFTGKRQGNVATCAQGNYEFRADIRGKRIQLTCAEREGKGFGESQIKERMTDIGCLPQPYKKPARTQAALE